MAGRLAKDVVRTLQPTGLSELNREWAFPWTHDPWFWCKPHLWLSQPLQKVMDYFGHERGLYFAFLQSYTRSLIVPSGE